MKGDDSLIQVNNLSKKFKEIEAVKDVSFKVEKGEIYGLIGENGAGKTTILRLLSTMLEPTSGDALLDGYSIIEQPEKVRESIGILFGGEVGLYDRLTARENIEYFGMLNDMSREDLKKRVEELSNILEMNEYIDRRTGKFSKGMKQKVAIARTIVNDPKILLLDEPTSGLDVSVTRIVHDFIKSLTKQGKTVVFSSHNMDEVKKLCKKVIVINKGRLIYNGDIDTLEKEKGMSLDDAFVEMVGGTVE